MPSDQKSHDDVTPFVAMAHEQQWLHAVTGHACIGRALIQDFGIALGCPHVRYCHRFLQALNCIFLPVLLFSAGQPGIKWEET